MPDAGVSARPDLDIEGLGHAVLAVSDTERSSAFFADVLGLTPAGIAWPETGDSMTLAAGDGQALVLAPAETLVDLRETGVHTAFAMSSRAREAARAALKGLGVEVFAYAEDPPDESKDGFYFFDPDGNRIQLMAMPEAADGAPPTLHHAAVQVADIMWAERFYTEVLGLIPVHRVGWNTADYARAQLWADGKEEMAPGTRRLDRRYSSMVNNRVVPRVNMQVYFACGSGRLGVYLANQHFQEPPEEACIGTPRIAFRVSAEGLADAEKSLTEANWRFQGPVSHGPGSPVAASIYLRDPGGNFIELATAGGGP